MNEEGPVRRTFVRQKAPRKSLAEELDEKRFEDVVIPTKFQWSTVDENGIETQTKDYGQLNCRTIVEAFEDEMSFSKLFPYWSETNDEHHLVCEYRWLEDKDLVEFKALLDGTEFFFQTYNQKATQTKLFSFLRDLEDYIEDRMREKADEAFNRFKSAGEKFEKFLAENNPEEMQTAIERIFEMYARDEEKHFTEEMLSAELEDREEFEKAFREHILGDLWMLRFGREETQQKIEELWEEHI